MVESGVPLTNQGAVPKPGKLGRPNWIPAGVNVASSDAEAALSMFVPLVSFSGY